MDFRLPLVSIFLVICGGATAQEEYKSLYLEQNGDVRFDGGTELDLDGLKAQFLTMIEEKREPEIQFRLPHGVKYGHLIEVLASFKEVGYRAKVTISASENDDKR